MGDVSVMDWMNKAGRLAAMSGAVAGLLLAGLPMVAQDSATAATAAPAQVTAAAAPAAQGGTIKGTVVAGTAGKPGGVPLPGVAVTAKNTITGKQYTTSTDIDGAYAMVIPKNGRYVIRAELTGFAAETHEVILNGTDMQIARQTDFGMSLASRVAAAEAKQTAATTSTAVTRGAQAISLSASLDASSSDATAGAVNAGTDVPSMGGLGDMSSADSVSVSGVSGQTNALAGMSQDEIQQRVQDAVAQARGNGLLGNGADPTNTIVGAIQGMMGGGGPGGGGGGGGRGGGGGGRGGGGGGRGGGGGGSGAFRNMNPAIPHGSVFYQGANSALNSAPWSPNLTPVAKPTSYSNNYGVTIGGVPYIPGLMKPDTKQFVFINLTGKKNLTASIFNGTVPTLAERAGNYAGAVTAASGQAINIFDPTLGTQITNIATISPTAEALLAYYPAANIAPNAAGNNYQTITNAGSNSVAINTRYVRTIGGTGTPGQFGGGGGARRGGNANAPPALRQNINVAYNYSHSASDIRNIFLPLGGATETDGNSLNTGYTIGYGRLSNNASLNWNRSNSQTRNYFTNTANDPSATLGLGVPNSSGGFANPRFYNGLPSFSITGYTGFSNTTPSLTINQTISFSDFISWRHGKHNLRVGGDYRRVHADTEGGSNALGSYTFSGYATEQPSDQVGVTQTKSGDGFADFLLGLPTTTALQAGLYKVYLRENVYDFYATDDWRLASNWTLNYGLRYEYFAPYTEKNNRLVNLNGVSGSGIATVGCVTPTGTSYTTSGSTFTCAAGGNASLVNPDRTMFAPRFGFAYRPKFKAKIFKDVVVRGGYGINFNTGQFAQFANKLSRQVPFASVQTNDFAVYSTSTTSTALTYTPPSATGCSTTQSAYTYSYVNANGQTVTVNRPKTTANMTLAAGFGCTSSSTLLNNYAVDPNYRLGMVQVYNFNIQKSIPLGIVLNLGYTGSKGDNLDVLGSPNATPSGTTTPGVNPFDYEESKASSRSNQLVISAQKRQQKGIALGATYTYSHSIDNAVAVGGASGSPVQNLYNLGAEFGNSSFDQRHNLTGNWVIEPPFGPNRKFLNKGGVMAKIFDGYSVSGSFTFGTGTYFTPTYSGNTAESATGNTFTQRPNRDYTQSTRGAGKLKQFFNTAAFSAPATGQYGNAAPGSIEGPGSISVSAALSRTVQLGGTNSFEGRISANNVFNTVQYSGINVTENSPLFGEVTSAASMRTVQFQARYRF